MAIKMDVTELISESLCYLNCLFKKKWMKAFILASVFLSACVHLSVRVCLSVCLSVCVHACLPAWVCLPICLWSGALADYSGELGLWKVEDPWAIRWLYAWAIFSHCNTERWRKTRVMATTVTTSGKARGPDCSVARCTIVISVEIYGRTIVSGVLRNSLTYW